MNSLVTALPVFSNIDLTQIESQLEALLQKNRIELKTILEQKPYTWETLMAPLEAMDHALETLWAPIDHLHNVADSESLRPVYQTCLSKLSDYSVEFAQNTELFHAVEAIAASPKFKTLDVAQRKIIQNMLRDFKLAGVHLSEEQKKRFSDLNQHLSQLATQFTQNLMDTNQHWFYEITDEAELIGLPDYAIATAKAAAENKGKTGWVFTLNMPSYHAVMTYADSQKLREHLYTAYVTRASELSEKPEWNNTQVMQDILNTRLEMSQLVGFQDYAEYSLATKMVKKPAEVLSFLKDLSEPGVKKAQAEIEELKQFAKNEYSATNLNPWDVAYYSEKLRQKVLGFSKDALRPYFEAKQVVQDLCALLNRLYGIELKPVQKADVWNPMVQAFAVYDAEQLSGYLYLDLYNRNGKHEGAWMSDSYSRRLLKDSTVQVPVAFVNCNFNAPTENTPTLLNHDDVVTLFHECGHALQHVLSKIDYSAVSGISGVPWDAVEIASQFMENWCWEPDSIPLISRHHETGEPLPQEFLTSLIENKNFQTGMQMVRQLQFALFDFRLHREYDPATNNQVQKILNEVREQLPLFPVPEWNRFQHGFSHIFGGGYAAGYYSYKWSELLSCDLFSRFLEEGIFNQQTGRRFLNTFIYPGGSEEPMDLFVEFMGRAPNKDALLVREGIV